jgi:hypothetical protein
MTVWFFIELVVAIVLVVVLMWLTYGVGPVLEIETLLIKTRIWEALSVLDIDGSLRYWVVRNDTMAIDEELRTLLSGLDFQVNLCYEPCNITLPYERVITISYLVSGDYGNFTPAEVLVNTWLE